MLVDIPKDVTAHKCEYMYPKTVHMRSYSPVTQDDSGQIKKAVDLMLAAQRPMFYTGGGVIFDNASAALTELVRLLVSLHQHAHGARCIPSNDPLFVGMLGMHGTYEANMAMYECDVLIAIGARFDDRVTGDLNKFCPHARIIHVDIDPASISKNVPVEVPIVGAAESVMRDMLKLLKGAKRKPDQDALAAWWKQIDRWRAMNCLDYDRDSKLIKPQYVIGDALRSDPGARPM